MLIYSSYNIIIKKSSFNGNVIGNSFGGLIGGSLFCSLTDGGIHSYCSRNYTINIYKCNINMKSTGNNSSALIGGKNMSDLNYDSGGSIMGGYSSIHSPNMTLPNIINFNLTKYLFVQTIFFMIRLNKGQCKNCNIVLLLSSYLS
jgi:hypothetical protein